MRPQYAGLRWANHASHDSWPSCILMTMTRSGSSARGKRPRVNAGTTKGAMRTRASGSEPSAASLRAIPEVDFSVGVQGKYAGRFQNVFVLDPDLMDAFPDSRSINEALRAVLALCNVTRPQAPRTKRRAHRR